MINETHLNTQSVKTWGGVPPRVCWSCHWIIEMTDKKNELSASIIRIQQSYEGENDELHNKLDKDAAFGKLSSY